MPQSPNCTAGVFLRDGKMLLGLRNYTTQQYKNASFWTTPGGRCEEGEEIEVAFRREVFEEIGIKDFVIQQRLGVVPGAKKGDKVHVFLCETDQNPILMEPEKFTEWKWFPRDQLPENFLNSDILKIVQTL